MPVTETKVVQDSASWFSGGWFQRQSMPQAAPSFGQPRPIQGSRHRLIPLSSLRLTRS